MHVHVHAHAHLLLEELIQLILWYLADETVAEEVVVLVRMVVRVESDARDLIQVNLRTIGQSRMRLLVDNIRPPRRHASIAYDLQRESISDWTQVIPQEKCT